MNPKQVPPGLFTTLTGRCFVHPLLDYLLIGGGLSLLVTAVVVLSPMRAQLLGTGAAMAGIVLFSNVFFNDTATTEIYTKPGAARSMPFLSKMVPPIVIILMTLSVVYVGRVGRILDTLYLTWSPYHYAAQAYGLAGCYGYRPGCKLQRKDKKRLGGGGVCPVF